MSIFVIEIGSDDSVIVHDKVRNENKRKIDKSYKIILYNCLYI